MRGGRASSAKRKAGPKVKKRAALAAPGQTVRQTGAASTRQAMLTAAIETIAELGYYRASSNEIARRAGFTWGVIQHHFKSREGLLLATIHDSIANTRATFADAQIRGDTLETRVRSFCEAIFAIYAAPSYVATLQILLDLARDPTHGRATREAVTDFSADFTRETHRLARFIRPGARISEDFGRFLGDAVWGLAVTEHIGRIYWTPAFEKSRVSVERSELVKALVARFEPLPTARS